MGLIAVLAVIASLMPATALAGAQQKTHPPGGRTWCAIVNGGDVTAKCEEANKS
jgi:hypothetical protein